MVPKTNSVTVWKYLRKRIITKYALKKTTNNIQTLYKSEVYSLFWLVLFSPSQNSAKKTISKTGNETY